MPAGYGHVLGLVNPVAGTVSGIPVNPLPPRVSGGIGFPNALAYDASLGLVYLGLLGTSQSWIYSVPFNGGAGGAPTQVAGLNCQIHNLAVESDGTIVGAGQGSIYRIDATTGAVSLVPLVPAPLVNIEALTIERATGTYLVGACLGSGAQAHNIYRVTPSGSITIPAVGTPPTGGWARIGGIALDPNPETYGPATASLNTYSWALGPNPGGLPVLGNTSFSLTEVSTPGGAPGIWAASLAPISPPSTTIAPGISLNIDPAQLVLIGPLVGLPVETISLSIPAAPQLLGLELFFQTAHSDPGGLGATRGLRFTVM